MKRLATSILILLLLASMLEGQNNYIVRKHPGISKKVDEIAAVEYGSDSVVYTTEAFSVGASSPSDSRGGGLFRVVVKDKENGPPKTFASLQSYNGHNGPVSFTADFNTMVFSRMWATANSRVDPMGLFFAEMKDGKWTNYKAYPHNHTEKTLYAPSISADGKMLFFAANFNGGMGDFDIYMSVLKNGNWTQPVNLGPSVNSDKIEFYPFIHSSGKLFLSSNGHDDSVDGFDIFECTFVDGQWIIVEKLSAPINSKANDYHLYFDKNLNSGYLTSDREGGSKDIFIVEVKNP